MACALGMGCKEVMVTAPLVVLLYDRTFVAGSFREALRRRPGLYAGLFATWGILAFLIAGGPRTESVGFALGLTPAQYLMAQSRVILYYLGLAFWPSPLVIAYHWNVYPTLAENLPYVLAVAGAGALAAWALLRKPAPAAGKSALGFAGAWFFLILAPTSSFVPIVTEVAAERRMYLPLAAIVAVAAITAWLAGAWLTRRLAASERARKLLGRGLALALVLPPAAGLGRLTHLRNEDYRTEVSIWEDAARKQPGSPRAWNNLAHACSREGRQQEAIEYYSRAIEMKPDYADAWYNRGQVYGGLGQYDQAIRDYGEAIRWNPDFALAFGARGHIECVLGRYEDAVHDYDRAIELNRNYVEAYNGRGNAYSETSRLTEAIGDYGKALALDAGYAEAYYNRADAYGRSGRWDLAAGDYDQFIELRPDFAAAYNKRAVACYQMKEYGKALADVKKFQELGGQPHPDFLKALLKAAGRSE